MRFTSWVSLVAWMLTFCSMANAAPPERETLGPFSVSGLAPWCDYTLNWDTVLQIDVTTYKDNNGVPIRRVERWNFHDTVYNPDNPDVVAQGTAHATANLDLQTGVWQARGTFFHLVVPGHGAVLIDVGLEVYTWEPPAPPDFIKIRGKHQWLNGEFDRICDALSGSSKPIARPETWGTIKTVYR